MKLSHKTKRKKLLDITPLIDVVFLLLIFFMLTFSLPEQGINLNLPPEGTGSATLQEPLILKVLNDGSLMLNDQNIGYDSLVPELQERLQERNEHGLTVDVNHKVGYENFVRVLDLAKKAGAESFSIIH